MHFLGAGMHVQRGTAAPPDVAAASDLGVSMEYAPADHTHGLGSVGVPSSRTLTGVGNVVGGGDLTQNREFDLVDDVDVVGTLDVTGLVTCDDDIAIAGSVSIGGAGALGGTSAGIKALGWGGIYLYGDVDTVDTTKWYRQGSFHYDNAEKPVAGLVISSDGSYNSVYLGGATGYFNAATSVNIYTTANNTTPTGTRRAYWHSNGIFYQLFDADFAGDVQVDGTLDVNGATTFGGNVTLDSASPQMNVGNGTGNPNIDFDKSAGNSAAMRFYKAGIREWYLNYDVASNLEIQRYVAGSFVDNVLSFDLSNGNAAFANNISAAAGSFTDTLKVDTTDPDFIVDKAAAGNSGDIHYQTGGAIRWVWRFGSSGQMELKRYNTSAVFQDNPISIAQPTGDATFANDISAVNGAFSGDVAVTGDVTGGQAVITETGTSYTLGASDKGKLLVFTNAGDVTLTIPTGLGIGFWCDVDQKGAGQVLFTVASTTLNSRLSHTKTAGRFAMAHLVADAADVFNLSGDTVA